MTGTTTDQSTPTLTELLERQRAAFRAEGIPDAATREDRIRRLQLLLVENAEDLATALREDFGTRPEVSSIATDIVASLPDMDHARKNLRTWMADTRVAKAAGLIGLRQRIRHEPKGVVGIMGPWNFPIQLVMLPAASALAAGNRVLMRPSEVTAATTQLLADLAGRYLDPSELAVVTDDMADGPTFAAQRFDHLFFTGSVPVGSLVAQAAAKNLVPVTLELGGKNPVVLDPEADFARAAKRVAASRILNGGQVCLCPDYVLVPTGREAEFRDAVLDAWRTLVPTVQDNSSYTSLIDQKNYDRVNALIEDAVSKGAQRDSAIPSGETPADPATRKIAPTVLTGVSPEMDVYSEEIFGPVLAIEGYDEIDAAVERIAASPSPLTLYWYGPENERFERLLDGTRSGSVNANDFGLTMINPSLPFGGVGHSGYGSYHGKAGFDTFSHARSVAFSSMRFGLANLAAPPYGRKDAWLNRAQLAQFRRALRD